ncbi:protein-L-isoaspartate(D-aspartate) O-methyltransferase [Taklimakanibacter deserti]|uniref:protein-L-isoaspartate(D-aspartate) O-methyltransferase n=1 Tax=Taklimakanibacter deserti TaxID=2267839 RepID=UPI000E65021C
MLDLDHARRHMVDSQIARRGVRDSRVLDAMRTVPREIFVDVGFEEFAYEDAPLPIAQGQTISQPYIVARMTEAAEIDASDRVLEVGTGSGYAAAVLSLLAKEVYSIERHARLAEMAGRRLAAGGYRNVEISVGDGTKGWPEAAPFDAILVTAGGPAIPAALKQQLAMGGRLIIPVGTELASQRLIRLTRVGEAEFEQEDLGGVMFVPLIGEHGWQLESRETEIAAGNRSLPRMITAAAIPLPDFDEPRFAEIFERFGDHRVVLLGEASHGTSEFYQARAAISRRLIEKHGFTIVAVEADWPDAATIDRHVRLRPAAGEEKTPFQRFPTWMWRNTDMQAFFRWLGSRNEKIARLDDRAGFYGLDLYNMSGSIGAVLRYLDETDPAAAAVARERYGCLTPWQSEPSTYGRAVLTEQYRKCEEAVVAQCRDLLTRQLDYAAQDPDSFLDAAQNARLIAAAERYYRVMYYGGAESWNLRDRHMFETLANILEAKGPDAKAIVWAHNSHIGDARWTEMGEVRDEINIGQLCRERFGQDAALIGFGTHSGTVACASHWDGPMEVKRVQPSQPGSYENLCHEAEPRRFFLALDQDGELQRSLAEPRFERFIGVIYRPETEFSSHYAEASLSRQFDAYVWFDETHAVTPVPTAKETARVPDTYPFGL